MLLGFERLTGVSAMGALLALHRALVLKPAGATERTDAAIRVVVALLLGLGLCVFSCCVCAVWARVIRFASRTISITRRGEQQQGAPRAARKVSERKAE